MIKSTLVRRSDAEIQVSECVVQTLLNGFLVDVPADTDVRDYTTVVIWCESFGQFISAAEYQASRLTRE